GAAERRGKQRRVSLARNADRAERRQMLGHELAIEKREIADLQARDQPGERDLGCVGPAAEHAFAEKGAAELHAIEAADQVVRLPYLDRMGVAGAVERDHRVLELGVDPRLLAVGAGG